MKKVYLRKNVFEAAQERTKYIFDEFDNIRVQVSGGKDSSVIADLFLKEAARRNVKIEIAFLDQEAEYQNSIDVVRYIMSHPNTIPLWYQVPFRMTNSVSFVEPFLDAWNPDKKIVWMREKEPTSIKELPKDAPDRFYPLLDWLGKESGRTANIIGLRSAESLNRYRSVIKNAGYKGKRWSTKGKGEDVKFYPIYDFGFDDVWKYIYDNEVVYNKIYDYQFIKDYSYKQMRVSYLMHEHSFRCLCDLPEFEPSTFERLCNRVSGIDSAMRYGKEKTMYNADKLPEHYSTWKEFRDFLLDGHPNKKQKERFLKRFNNQLKTESVHRRQVAQLLINDYEGGLELKQDDLEEKKKERKKKIKSIL